MKVLIAHNFYQQRGGEDSVMEAEKRLLVSTHHEVLEYFRHNDEIRDYSFLQEIRLASGTLWAADTHRSLRRLLRDEKPTIAHFHNVLPLISPSAYYACKDAGIPVVQAVQNFRLLCPSGNLFRDGRVCEECIEHTLVRGVLHACYRDSRPQTAVVAGMLALHRKMKTWSERVDAYVVCTEFARGKLVSQGFPACKIFLKPNFVFSDPGPRSCHGETPLVVGRLSAEKGQRLLPQAWSRLGGEVPLRIVGDGPLRSELESAFARSNGHRIMFEGWLPKEKTIEALMSARFLVFPSQCYEGFPVTIAEAYSCGLPVIAPRLGAMAEIVEDGRTGLHFSPGDPEDLAAKVEWAWTHAAEMEEMGRGARAEYEAKYTPERNYKILMEIYERAICTTRSVERPSE
jgi:glycosyltransferase involved in cell wall biosynthesis